MINKTVAVAMMLAGISAALIWKTTPELSRLVYEVLPGMAAGILVYLIAQFFIGGNLKTVSRQ
ncbi:MAG: hypothetical protein HC836_02585 [Richelia sp. RM2_1_2]|nr:hypothetical protein [Richelia sp. SM2_1_7]NJM18506.1 hypothetical protein [Richelia sp. SM1_7_0]NJN08554.1 hypothetical protein [Richelia sp. RM1_1_1]NJO27571.1 hypothetical protein [Richelia sp. SL_2_1]NJO57297.1 hypothetical protein [Richelia sp. RM2_1_2]NJS16517.1 hypothetical protein [Nostocaceae cyanobacterium CSU_2_110]